MRRSWHSLALKIHLFGGLLAAVFLLLLGATGSIMAFESDIDQLLHPSLFHVTPVGKALPLGTLAGNAAATLGPGERIGIYILPVKPDLSYGFTVFAAKKLPRQIFVDAYSGRVLGSLSALRFVVVCGADDYWSVSMVDAAARQSQKVRKRLSLRSGLSFCASGHFKRLFTPWTLQA